MFLSFEQVSALITVKTVSALTIPGEATRVSLQADTQNVRYTMDDSTDPAQTSGMVLIVGNPPEEFLIADLRRIKFVRGSGSNGNLNLHYSGRQT